MQPPPPLDPDHLFGRATERARVEAAWATGARFVTLVGPPGAGKTRLARAMGGLFVDLVAARDAAAVCRALATALDVRLGDQDPARAQALIARGLQGREVTVILDNLEQLVEVVAPLMDPWQVPGVRWLGTSRRPVGVVGEVVVPVGGLARDAAVALFRARAWTAGMPLDADAPVTALVEALDGLPLALELAAARTPLLGVAELHRAVAADPRVLQRAGGGRHAGLEAALATSWTLLAAADQVDLQRLTVAQAPMTLPAAAAVLGRDAAAALDVLGRLRLGGWLRVEPGPPSRYRLYVGVAAFVRSQGEVPDAAVRHVVWHGAEAHRLWSALKGPQPSAALDVLATLAADLAVAAAHGPRLGLPEAAAWAAIGLHVLTADRGPWHAGTTGLDAALAAQPPQAEVRIELLTVRALTLALRGHNGPATTDLESALALAEAGGDPVRVITVLGVLGPVRRFVGRLAEAEALARREEALAIAQGLPRELARARFNLAGARLLQGHPAEADALWATARAGALAAEDVRLAALCLANRSVAAQESGRLAEAEVLLEAAAVELAAAERPVMLAKLIAQRAQLALARGDLDAAAARIAEGKVAAERLFDGELAADIAVAAAQLAERRQSPEAPALWAAARALGGEATPNPCNFNHLAPTDAAPPWSVDLTRRPVLRRVLAALTDAGAPLSVADLVDAAWPGERIQPEAAASRVYTAIRALRRLGAPIVTVAELGYALAVATAPPAPPPAPPAAPPPGPPTDPPPSAA